MDPIFFTFLGAVIVVCFGAVIYRLWAKSYYKGELLALKSDRSEIELAVNEYEEMYTSSKYLSNFQFQLWCKKYQVILANIPANGLRYFPKDAFVLLLRKMLRYADSRADITTRNNNICEVEALELEEILLKRRIPSSKDQLLAAVSEEDNTLVVAGAGTGKTTTILEKLAYLIDRLEVKPEDILLLSFTGKAVEELQARIDKYFPGIPIQVRTFHGFGFSVLGKVLGKKPDLAFANDGSKQKWMQKEFETLLAENPEYLRAAIHYFAFYLNTEEAEPIFNTLDEYYRYIESERILTFQKELVKSQQEAMIANFLYLHKVEYIYEKPYEKNTSDSTHRQYAPDFYLPEYGIYLEHFGIDRQGNVHFLEDKEKNRALSVKYREDMQWKRQTHTTNNTTLVETYSYEFHERTWEKKLSRKLLDLGVNLKERPISEVLNVLREGDQMYQIITLFLTFLDLAKANQYRAQDIKSIVDSRNRPREIAFSKLFLALFQKYEAYLLAARAIDFHDMLNKASDLIGAGELKESYKYIIIDEFQDFSVSKNKMIQALKKQSPETKLFCVGDDWQAIFRFAGSDVSLMTHFEKYHGYTNFRQLVQTNRFDARLAHTSNAFILKNPSQIKKNIRATRELPFNPLEIIVSESIGTKGRELDQVLTRLESEMREQNKKASVMLLGRYSFNKPENLEELKAKYKNLEIEFFTIHRAKGSEADFVIILDVVEGKYGFPSNISDDPLLELVLSMGESFPHAEERRLMYVALTRTRERVYVLTMRGQVSPFVLELDADLKLAQGVPICPECSGVMTERKGPFGQFYGCSNYPRCKGTRKIPIVNSI